MSAQSPRFRAITPREASIFACVADALLAPEPLLPPVRETTTAAGLDDWLARSPAINRHAVRAGLYLLEVAPLLTGDRRRFRRLAPERRRAFLAGGKRRPVWIAAMVDTMRMLAAATYYGDDGVARRLGYDADARLRRGRELRTKESRP